MDLEGIIGDAMEFILPQDTGLIPCPEEVDYWSNRKNRIFFIDYDIEGDKRLLELAKTIVNMNYKELTIPKEQLEPIYLWIHSYGGDADQAQFFADLIESSRIPVITVGMGAVMSAGFIIFLSGKRRYAFKHSQFLAHSGAATVSGTASEVEEFQKNYKKQIAKMGEYIISHTSIDQKTYNRNKNKDWYLSDDDLIKYHIVDAIIEKFDDIK